MTDEEYGRAFASQTGREPSKTEMKVDDKVIDIWWAWYPSDRAAVGAIPSVVAAAMPAGYRRFPTEAEAYAALGRAVREVHRLVPEVAGQESAERLRRALLAEDGCCISAGHRPKTDLPKDQSRTAN